jgi:hypothetical protein
MSLFSRVMALVVVSMMVQLASAVRFGLYAGEYIRISVGDESCNVFDHGAVGDGVRRQWRMSL